MKTAVVEMDDAFLFGLLPEIEDCAVVCVEQNCCLELGVEDGEPFVLFQAVT